MGKIITFAILTMALPGAALAGASAKDSDTKRVVCTKSQDARIPARERRVECRTIKIVPAIVDPTPMFIL